MYRALVAVLLLLSACGGSGGAQGAPCTRAQDCESNFCYAGSCATTCAASTDCPDGLACGTPADGERVCQTACQDGTFVAYGVVCIDGAPVACERAGARATCDACGCPDGERCNEQTVCAPLAAVGAPCTEHDQCASFNCGFTEASPTGICLVGKGEACTGQNCLSCDPTIDGDVCAQNCRSDAECGEGYSCKGYQGDGFYSCRQNCDTARCPAFWSCPADLPVSTCEPAQRCDPSNNLSCGAVYTCDPEYHLCGLFP